MARSRSTLLALVAVVGLAGAVHAQEVPDYGVAVRATPVTALRRSAISPDRTTLFAPPRFETAAVARGNEARTRPLQGYLYGGSWAGRHPALVGALVGFGIGAMAAVVTDVCHPAEDRENYCGAGVLAYGALGATVGAVIGYRMTP